MISFSTLVELLEYQASAQPQAIAYQFLTSGERVGESLTYRQLQQKAKAIAAHLQSLNALGERALLLYPPGLEFISAFFGCLYAGVIAVPIYPPHRNQNKNRLDSVIKNSQAQFVLGTGTVLATLESSDQEALDLTSLTFLATDTIDIQWTQTWLYPVIDSQTLAFLQYTSGSTGNPKGVMVSHQNLIHNEEMIARAFGHHEQRVVYASWLPLFHDMGLIGNVLQSLYLGVPCILMSPVDFLQKPVRWLEMISKYRATTSGAPNFAYDLCVRKVTPEQMEALDLSGWDIAFSGSEPVHAQTLDNFAAKFADCGFRKEAFYPCYGMAEATLFISGGLKRQEPITETINESALEENLVLRVTPQTKGTKTLVGCGRAWLDDRIIIVNAETLTRCSSQQVGEIWVSNRSVAQGYWNQPEKTQETFQVHLADRKQGLFLRTGDLGFLREDRELFMTGRLKDLIIIRGRNHYPQDIEQTVEESHPALIPHRSAAFSVEVKGEEQLVVVVEVERRYRERRSASDNSSVFSEQRKYNRRTEHIDPGFEVDLPEAPIFQEIVNSIRQAITSGHGLQVHEIVLLRVGTIPKTSSGKIQRYLCRRGFQEKSLTAVHSTSHS